MKRTLLLSAALFGALSLACVAHSQGMSDQQNAPSASTSSGNTEYGGVSGTSSATGGSTRAEWTQPATCGRLSHCNPNAGH